MKKILALLLVITTFIACTKKSAAESNETSVVKSETNFDWLLGNWKRSNDKPEQETFENWQKISETEYRGFGYTLKNKDTLSQEKMTLVKNNDQWDFIVKIPSERNSVIFKLIDYKENEFTCVNDSNDFPKKIVYWLENNKMKAKISNTEMEISFEFEKIK